MKNNRMSWLVGLLSVLLLAAVVVLGAVFGGETLNSAPLALNTAGESEVSVSADPALIKSATLTAAGEETEAEEPAQSLSTDYAAIYALYRPDQVVMTVDGTPVPWQDYFYSYYSQAYAAEQQFQAYQQYGLALGWNSQADEEGHSYAELLGEMTEKNLRQVLAVESLAEEKALQLTEEEEQELQDVHQENIRYSFGEEGTEEQLFEELWNERYLTPEYYWRLMRVGYLAEGILRETYGVEGEKLSEEEILAWMEEQGIVSANHILIATVDLQTRQPLDEDTLKEKTELAQQLARELQAIEDPAELEKRFTELKEQYCADGNSYVFGEGVMVPEFYEGTLALEVGQVSDPVQSSYGYHVILRRPLHADDTIRTGSGMVNAASLMAQQSFSKLLQDRLDGQTVEYEEGFQSPNILDYRVSNLEDK